MEKEKVTKEEFKKFEKLRRSGVINMNDIVTGSTLCEISEDTYETIMWNYKYLKEKYINKQKL